MELNFVISIIDRDKRDRQAAIYKSLGLKLALTMLGRGTATSRDLLIHGLTGTEKAVMATVADRESTRKLITQTKVNMFIDIPGNGIMMSVPIKSIGGAQTMAYLTENKPMDSEKPKMEFAHELIYVILNEGYSDMVMDAARPAGAGGGTVISAKGTMIKPTEKFHGMSIADEKEVLLIVASAKNKADIVRAIMEKAGTQTKAEAVCFSLPVSQVAGLRRIEEDEE